MYIVINDQTTIAEIEKAFTDFYPYLEIHFYKKPHNPYKESSESDRINLNLNIGSIKTTHTDGILAILPDSKVMSIEKELSQRFDLSVQICRKQNGSFIQSAGEDDFTIKELNLFGRNASDDYIMEEEDTDPGEEKPEQLL
jgi:hypothetical protein